MKRTLVLATSNASKVREIRQLLEGVPLELLTLDAWPGVEAPEETGRTFADNARQKALCYAAATGELVVAEDSGLEIDALGGAPGVESARYGGVDATYPEKFARIYEEIERAGGAGAAGPIRIPPVPPIQPVPPTARFVCALAVARDGRVCFEARGTIEGEIAPAPRGSGGFGYDPIFFYPPYGRTLAEVTADDKAAVSHRGKAFRQLRGWIESGLKAETT